MINTPKMRAIIKEQVAQGWIDRFDQCPEEGEIVEFIPDVIIDNRTLAGYWVWEGYDPNHGEVAHRQWFYLTVGKIAVLDVQPDVWKPLTIRPQLYA